MAFITVANAQKMIKKLDENHLAYIDQVLFEKRNIDFFNRREVATLKGLRELMRNGEKFLAEYYQPIKVVDTKRYLYPESQPSYHVNSECDNIHSDYINYEIPHKIRERNEVDRYRRWFKERNMHEFSTKEYIEKLQLAFPYVGPININSIERRNSGQEEIKNYSLKELENEINRILSEAENFFSNNPKLQSIIEKYKKASFLGYTQANLYNKGEILSNEELRNFLKHYHENYKKPVKDFLVEYYKIQFNPDMTYDGRLLIQLGFKQCSLCHDINYQMRNSR